MGRWSGGVGGCGEIVMWGVGSDDDVRPCAEVQVVFRCQVSLEEEYRCLRTIIFRRTRHGHLEEHREMHGHKHLQREGRTAGPLHASITF